MPTLINHRRPARRTGISLLEVLISAFVITIGLLGVAALMPVGHLQTARGARADRAGAMSRMAFRDFKVRGMAQVGNWVSSNGAAYSANNGQAVAIDPLYLANNSGSQFPAVGATVPTMARITLRNGTASGAMGSSMASLIFSGDDDLALEKPASLTDAPRQLLTSSNDRLSEGHYSWLATLVPRQESNLWMLSVVVFHKRDFTGEQVFDAKVIGPTEITLLLPTGSSSMSRSDANKALDITADWIMLSQQNGGFAWYRLVSTSKIEKDGETDNRWSRFVTVEGPDLNGSLTTQAFIFPGAVAVQQRTVHLEGPSAWTAQQ